MKWVAFMVYFYHCKKLDAWRKKVDRDAGKLAKFLFSNGNGTRRDNDEGY